MKVVVLIAAVLAATPGQAHGGYGGNHGWGRAIRSAGYGITPVRGPVHHGGIMAQRHYGYRH